MFLRQWTSKACISFTDCIVLENMECKSSINFYVKFVFFWTYNLLSSRCVWVCFLAFFSECLWGKRPVIFEVKSKATLTIFFCEASITLATFMAWAIVNVMNLSRFQVQRVWALVNCCFSEFPSWYFESAIVWPNQPIGFSDSNLFTSPHQREVVSLPFQCLAVWNTVCVLPFWSFHYWL